MPDNSIALSYDTVLMRCSLLSASTFILPLICHAMLRYLYKLFHLQCTVSKNALISAALVSIPVKMPGEGS